MIETWKNSFVRVLFITLMLFITANCSAASVCKSEQIVDKEVIAEMLKKKRVDRGLLWEISKNGHLSYLYGTIHVAELEWDVPGPTISAALNKSDTIAVELDITNSDTVAKLNSELSKQEGDSTLTMIPSDKAELDQRISAQFNELCLDSTRFQSFNASTKITILGVNTARDIGLYPEYSIDSSIIGYGKAQGKRIVEIENSTEQANALRSDYLSMIKDITSIENGEARKDLIDLSRAWSRSDLVLIEEQLKKYYQKGESTVLDNLFKDRNLILSQKLEKLFSQNAVVFAAIGTFHMVGENNVLFYLKSHGYDVKTIPLK